MTDSPDPITLSHLEKIYRRLEELTELTVSIARSEEKTNSLAAQQRRMEDKLDKVEDIILGPAGLVVKQTKILTIVSGITILGSTAVSVGLRYLIGG